MYLCGLVYSHMHSREFYYDNYKNHPEHVLKRIAGDYRKLTPEAQEALRAVLRDRNMNDLLSSLVTEEKRKQDLSHLSPHEIRAIINTRLDRGEKIEIIKADLQEKGVKAFDLAMKEGQAEEKIQERFIELQKQGKSKSEIDQKLKEEFSLPGKEAAKIPEKMRSSGTGLIVAGGVLLMICLPLLAVAMQSRGHTDLKYPLIGAGAGIGCLILGIRKRMIAGKFIKEAENNDDGMIR